MNCNVVFRLSDLQKLIAENRNSVVWKAFYLDPDEMIAEIGKIKNHQYPNIMEAERRIGSIIAQLAIMELIEDPERLLELGCD